MERGDLDGVAAELEVGTDPLGAVLPALSAWRRRRRERSQVDRWRYRTVWRPLEAGSATRSSSDGALATTPALTGRWLLLIPADLATDPWADAAERALTGHGAEVERVTIDTADTADTMNAADASDGGRDRFAGLLRDGTAGVLSLLALDDAP
ncbi:hypothetical protein JHN52_40520, partial [Streptomyces sp. MBT97]|uniref:hypothetical protein n=1 Tax=Streptomyces sp. MBT97 TaxID=2800411 RepID=UPI00190CAB32